MNRHRFNSLQARLILLGTLSVAIALVTACLGFMWTDQRTLHQAKRRQLQAQAEIVGFNSAAVLLIGDARAGEQLLAPFSSQPSIDAAALYTDDGHLLAVYTAVGAPAPPRLAPTAVGHGQNGAGDLEYVQAVIEGGERVGKLYLRANMQDLWRQTQEHMLVSLVVVAASLTTALPLAYALARATSRPILDLAQTAGDITRHGDFSIRVQSTLKNEIGTLYRAFNDLLQHVDASERALKTSQDELEQRVEQRTEELQEQIRARERVQQDLILAKDAAEAGSRAKSEFLANMSHEIRTPMNGVLGLTELVLDTSLTRDQRESMEMVKTSGEALMIVINDILDFSKIEAGKLELDPIEFVLRNLLEDTLKSLGLRAHRKGLELACEIGSEVPARIIGDPGRLRQVLINLVGNAIKFTEQGEVTVLVETLSDGSTGAGPSQPGSDASQPAASAAASVHLRFAVRDTGIGIPPEKQRAVFEAFSQADGSMTRKFGGTGLGLTISSQLVALMGGRLQVESAVGSGSTFHFAAHFQVPGTPPPFGACRMPASLQDQAILIVDDNATNRRILEDLLQRWGARPVAANSGKTALAMLRGAAAAKRPIPLLLVDAMMPEMDGFSLIRAMLQDPTLPGHAVMMLSSADNLGDAQRCRELGIAFLVKPIKSNELHCAITALLDENAATDHPTGATLQPPETDLGESSTSTPRKILLAEDNPVNQRVALRILAKRGHHVTVVGNGQEALDALATGSFDVVLMDVQMPVMDGLKATRAIRLEETASGRHLPIIAMTAHAMKGDRDRCLAEGMDDYITKPIDPKLLISVMERTLQILPQNRADEPRSSDVSVNRSRIINLEELRVRVENDDDLLLEIIGLFLNNSQGMLQAIETAVKDRNCRQIERAAHSLKGAVRNLSCYPCALAAEALEVAGRSERLTEADELLRALREELDLLRSVLQQIGKESSAARPAAPLPTSSIVDPAVAPRS